MVKREALIASLLVFGGVSSLAQTAIAPAGAEQRQFSMEDESVKLAASVPPEIIALLARDPDVKDALAYEHLATETIPSSWFLASEVHLSSASEKNFVVIGRGPLLGANVTTFWIFRPRDHRYELVLKAPAHTLVVKNTRSNGYRDIQLLSATAVTESTVLCRFGAGTYRPSVKSLEPIR
jgi:hypothetical protein